MVRINSSARLCGAGEDDKPPTREQLAQHLRVMVAESHAPAELALKQLRKLARKENFKSLGFESLEELQSAELGTAFPMSSCS